MKRKSDREIWIIESKKRCKRMGLNPNKLRITKSLSRTELIQRQTSHKFFIESALPYMKICSETFRLCGSILILTDSDGYILKAVGTESMLQSREKMGLGEGTSLREEDAGTNAVALAIRYLKPVYVEGKEYYLKIFQSGACFCAPILCDDVLLGTIVIVHTEKKGHPHTFALVKILARLIEEKYKNSRDDAFLISLANSINISLVITERNGTIKWLTPKSRTLLKISVGENILNNFEDSIISKKELVNEIVASERLEKSFLVVRRRYNDKFFFIFEPISANLQRPEQIKIIGAPYTFNDIVGLETIKAEAKRLALSDINILLFGESGTGKELFASAIHNSSVRAGERFVVVNCAAMPETLFESELFGYKKGAFTDARNDKQGKIEYANNGTLFFDEIAELPLEVQAKLLRVLEDKKVIPLGSNEGEVINVRFIFATNKNLEELVKQGRFREDLYYRIHSPVIKIPPLRERRGEIPDLIDYLLLKIRNKHRSFTCGLTQRAKESLLNYDFPGNVRELEGILQQAFLTCNKEYIDIDDLELAIPEPASIEEKVKQYKAKLIYECFVLNGKDINKTCNSLKISRAQLYRYIKIATIKQRKKSL